MYGKAKLYIQLRRYWALDDSQTTVIKVRKYLVLIITYCHCLALEFNCCKCFGMHQILNTVFQLQLGVYQYP